MAITDTPGGTPGAASDPAADPAAAPVALDEIGVLAQHLHETAQQHDHFEKASAPHDWWDWYAPYLQARQSGRSAEEATEAADQYMAAVRGVHRRR